MNNLPGEAEIFATIEKRAAQNTGETYKDENGVLRCSVCHEKLKVYIEEIDREVTVACSCRKRQEEERIQRQHVEDARSEAKHNALFDANYDSFTFSSDDSPDSDASKLCRSYVENWEEMSKKNFGLILSGTLGTGKTFLAACIVNELRRHGIYTLIFSTSRLLSVLKSSDNPQTVIDKLGNFQLIALDDVGSERGTDYAIEQIEGFINSRYLQGKPLIATTNLTGKELNSPSDFRYARIFDRIRFMCPVPVILTGQSRRVRQRQERAVEMKRILNCG